MYITSYGWYGTQKKASFGNDSPREGDSLSWRIFCDRPCLRGRLPGGRQLGPQRPPSPHRMDRGNELRREDRTGPRGKDHGRGDSLLVLSKLAQKSEKFQRIIIYITSIMGLLDGESKGPFEGKGVESEVRTVSDGQEYETHLLMRRNTSVSGGQGFDPIHLCPKGFTGIFQIIIRLKAKPESFRHTKEPGQPQGRIGGDGPLPLHDLIDPSGRNVNVFRQSVLAQIHGFKKLLKKNFSRMNRRIISHFSSPFLMIIDKQDQLPLDTGPSPGSSYGAGARNTNQRRTPPRQTSGFFRAPIFPAAFPIRSLMPGVGRIQDPSGKSRPPYLWTVSSARRHFDDVFPNRLEIDQRSLP